MRPLTIFQGGLFAALVLGIAAAAGTRAVPFHLPAHAEWFDGRLAKAFESHYDEVFPAKTLGTNLWAAVEYVLFGEGRPGVVVGKQGWLYTDEEFRTAENAEQHIATHLALIPWVRDELARQGTSLLVAVVPSKVRIYPEFAGERQPARVHGGLYQRAQRALTNAGITSPDLARSLNECKRTQPAFLRTDTHWTGAGARCAAEGIAAAAREAGLAAPVARYRTRVERIEPHRGDLFKFLPLEPYFARFMPPGETVEILRTEPESGDSGGLLDDSATPRVVLVGTSYSADSRWNLTGALQEALREDVANYAVRGQGPFMPMLDYLLRSTELPFAPRLVVWEIPERHLPIGQDLKVTRDAQAAPVCDSAARAPAGRSEEDLL